MRSYDDVVDQSDEFSADTEKSTKMPNDKNSLLTYPIASVDYIFTNVDDTITEVVIFAQEKEGREKVDRDCIQRNGRART